jgi:hypothetical protein
MDGNNFLDQIFAFRIVCIHKIFIVVVNSSASFKQCINAHRQNEFLKKTDEDDIPPSEKHNTICVGHHYPKPNTTHIRRHIYKQLEAKLNR